MNPDPQLLSPDRKFQLVTNIKCRRVGDKFLWVAPAKGAFFVLNRNEHRVFGLLVAGHTPAAALQRLSPEADERKIWRWWETLRTVAAKMARWGFVRGIGGDLYPYSLNPERFARLHITKRCQLRCIHCYSNSGPDCSAHDELPTSRWKALIEEFAASGGTHLLFTGGEPLIRRDCSELLECAKKSRLFTRILTNGLLVPRYLDVLVATVSGIQVSLGSPEEESNDLIRGTGTYRHIVHALDLLVKTPIHVQVGITAMVQNWRAIERSLLHFAERYDGTGMHFHVGMGVCRHGRGFGLGNDLDTERIRFRLLALVDEVNRTSSRKVISVSPGCGYCEQLVVGPEGNIYPCHLLEGVIGHVDDMPLKRFFPRLRALAKRHQVGYMETCKTCDLRKLCGGTCRIVNEALTGSRFRPDCSKQDRAQKLRNLAHWAMG
jgi:radical SAM protein with 4Fe4S-binding SPASM domain